MPPLSLLLAVFLGKAVPSGQLDGVTEKRILVIVRTPRFASALDSAFEILLTSGFPEQTIKGIWRVAHHLPIFSWQFYSIRNGLIGSTINKQSLPVARTKRLV